MRKQIDLFCEDSFDNVEYEDYGYTEENVDDGYQVEEEDYESDDDASEDEESDSYETECDDSDDWAIDGLNKTYEGADFSMEHAKDLYFKFDEGGIDFDVKSQCEAVRYANYYAKKGSNEAKNFIVFVIQDNSGEATNIAKTSLNLFLRNYIRREVEKFYARQPISDHERYERCPDAIQECFVYVYKHIDSYDPTKGKITTFFCSKILNGVISEYEAKRKGRGSKQTLKNDKVVAKAMNELEQEGYSDPSPCRLAIKTGMNPEAVLNSKKRIIAERHMTSFDDPNNVLNESQKRFDMPEEYVERNSTTDLYIAKLMTIPEEEREIFLAAEGIFIEDGALYVGDARSEASLAKDYGKKVNEIKYTVNSVRAMLKNRFSSETDKPVCDHDRLLSGRKMTFVDDEADSESDEFYEDIVEIY